MKDRFKTRMSWREKLEKQQEPRIVNIPPKMVKRLGKGKMLIPKPLDVDALIQKVKKGKLVTQNQIREKLAKDYNVNCTCPITTGIFIRIVAEAAEEDLRKGKKQVTPYWRMVGLDGSLNPKFPGGVKKQAKNLEKEGYVIVWDKKVPKVKDFEKFLVKF